MCHLVSKNRRLIKIRLIRHLSDYCVTNAISSSAVLTTGSNFLAEEQTQKHVHGGTWEMGRIGIESRVTLTNVHAGINRDLREKPPPSFTLRSSLFTGHGRKTSIIQNHRLALCPWRTCRRALLAPFSEKNHYGNFKWALMPPAGVDVAKPDKIDTGDKVGGGGAIKGLKRK